MKKAYINLIAIATLSCVMYSCTKKFEEINTDPNRPVVAPTTNVLAYIVENYANAAFGAGTNMSELETFGGHLGKIQYVDESRYEFSGTSNTTNWNATFLYINNALSIIKQAEADGTPNMQAAATTMLVYMFQTATDRWRDIPFSEAARGNEGFITPAYDKQETIYPELVKLLKKAADLFASGGTDQLGKGDILYGGSTLKWRKFCNSLRLRLAIRISMIDPGTSKSIIEEITGNPTTYPVFQSNADNAYFIWSANTPYQEPWFDNSKTRDDHGIAINLVDSLKSLSDPRLTVYAKPAVSDGQYRGVVIGLPGVVSSIGQYSRIGARFRDVAAGFSPFMGYAEVQFILAEAATKGWSTGTTAENAYKNGITASLAENGITASGDVNTYLNSAKVAWNGDVKQIYMQKWIALYKNGVEAWAESRRTDFPLMPAAPGSSYQGHNRPPFRYPYPPTETTLNGANSAAFIAEIKDNYWGKKMWWDTRTGVQ
jgi:hypothetical protein